MTRPQGTLGYKYDPINGSSTPMPVTNMSMRDSQNTVQTQSKKEAA
jgi:hypothetical protein